MAHGKPSVIYLVQFARKRNRKNKLIAKLIPVPKVENLQRQTTLFCDEGKCKFVLHFLMIEKVRFPFYWTTLKFPHILTLISSLVSGEICVVFYRCWWQCLPLIGPQSPLRSCAWGPPLRLNARYKDDKGRVGESVLVSCFLLLSLRKSQNTSYFPLFWYFIYRFLFYKNNSTKFC